MDIKDFVLNTLFINWVLGIITMVIYCVLYFSSEEFDAKVAFVSAIFGFYGTIIYFI